MKYVIFNMYSQSGFTGEFYYNGEPEFTYYLHACQLYYSKQEAIYMKKQLERNFGYNCLWVYSYSEVKNKLWE